jgi:WD40 repeat protein/serine/threonine protein kinase/tetratricopeptide (TPR) repeat protein
MFDAHALSAELPRLPLPLAQTLRRALNAKSPQEAHTAAYYFFESALKLSTAAQVGVYVQLGAGDAPLNELLENLTRASTGHWLAMLRELSAHHAKRSDKSLVPLADVSERLTKKEPRPAARAFLDFAAKLAEKPDGRKSLSVLDFFDTVVSYRNQELGHGAQRTREFYAEAAPLILNATIEAISVLRPLGELQLAVSREVIDPKGNAARIYQRLAGDGVQAPVTGVALNERDKEIPAGRVVLAAGAVRVMLHPLVVYEVDELERERVGFLNLVSSKRVAAKGDAQSMISVKRVEYLDYDSGARIAGQDAVEGLAQLLTRLRGKPVSAEAVEQLAAGAQTQIIEREDAAPGTGQWIGDFEILEELGRGGMGIVYKARQGSLGRIVALKVLPPGLAGDPVAVARFKREVAALGRCDHPNVVKVLTAGQDGDRYFYAMEYVEGCDLAGVFGVMTQWVTQSGGRFKEGHLLAAVSTHLKARKDKSSSAGGGAIETLPHAPQAASVMPQLETGTDYYKRIAQIIADAARGVAHLHEHGIVHRDLKPGNIMLTQDGKRAIVMDLGLAQMQGGGASLTQSNVRIVGTLRYMPPEQLQRHLLEVTPLADVYSLGATLYELACLAPMFDGDSEARLIQQVLQEAPKSPRNANPALPDDLATIINVATAKAPAERYGSAEKLAQDLEAFSRGDPISMRPPGALHYLRLFYRRNKAMAHTAAAALLLLVALSAWFVVNLNERRAEAESARDDAQSQRKNAEKQAELARTSAEFAREQEGKAREGETRAREAEAKSKSEAERASRAEIVTRQRLAESRVLQADALFTSGRRLQAKQLYAQASDELRALGGSSFNADLGWAIAEDKAPDPLVIMPGSPYGNIGASAFSPDASICAMAAQSDIALWDTVNWKELRRLSGTPRLISCLAFSPDGKYLASGGGDKCVAIWRVSDGQLVHRISGHGENVSALVFSPDGKYIVSGDTTEDAEKGNNSIRFWNVETGKEAMYLRGPVRSTSALAFSPDGKWLLACNNKPKAADKRLDGVQIWSVNDGQPYFMIDERGKSFCACTFSPDGSQVLAGSSDGRVYAWNFEDFKLVLALPVVAGAVQSFTWAAGGRTCLVAGQNGQLCQFRPADGTTIREFKGHTGDVLAAAYLGEESCVSAGTDNAIRIWNIGTGLETRGFEGHNQNVYCVAISPDGRLVASGGWDNSVKLWDSRTGLLLRTLRGHRNNIGALEFSPDGKLLASGEATLGWQKIGSKLTVRIWDVLDGTEVRAIEEVEYPIYGVMFTPDSKRLLTGGTAKVLDLWDVQTAKPLARFTGHTATIWAAHFSSDGKTLLTGSDDETLRQWETDTGKELRRFELGVAVHCARYSRDGTFIAAGMTDGTVRLIDSESGQLEYFSGGQFKIHGGSVDWISFLDDDRSLVTMCNRDQSIVVTDYRDGATATRSITPSPGIGERGRFSADGRVFVSPSGNRSVSVWEIGRGLERRPLWEHTPDLKMFDPADGAGRIAIAQSTDLGPNLPMVQSLSVFDGASGRVLWSKEFARSLLCMKTSADGSLLLAQDATYQVQLLDGITGELKGEFKGWSAFKGAFSGDGSLLVATGRDNKVRVFKPRENPSEPVVVFESPMGVISLAVSDSGKFIALACTDQIARIFDANGKRLHTFEGHSSGIQALAFSEDETRLATGDNSGEIRVWSLTGAQTIVLRKHDFTVQALAFFGGCVVSSGDVTVRVWDLASGGELRTMPAAADFRAIMAKIGPALIADANKWKIYVWDIELPGRTRDARLRLENARISLKQTPRDPAALMELANWFALRGRPDWACEFIERARQGTPPNDLQVAGIYLDACRLEQSSAALEAALRTGKATPPEAEAFKRMQLATVMWRGQALLSMARLREALPWYNAALKLAPKNPAALQQRGQLQMRLKDFPAALADFEAVLVLSPDNVEGHEGRAACLEALEQYDKAMAEYVRLQEIVEEAPYFVLKQAECLFKLKRYDDCVKLCSAFLDEQEYSDLRHQRASAYWELKKWPEAAADFSVLKKKRAAWFDFANAAYCEAKAGDFDTAITDLESALSPRAELPIVQYMNAVVYALRAASHPDTEEGKAARAEDITTSLENLEQSALKNFGGFASVEKISVNEDFAALKEEPRFKKLIGK